LADHLHAQYESEASKVFKYHWQVRDAFGEVAGTSDVEKIRAWVAEKLDGQTEEASIDRAVMLLELERNALRLFTSCAWFFDDLAGVEPVQILRYAARGLDLIRRVGGTAPAEAAEAAFLDLLDDAESNDPEAGGGRDIFLEQAHPTPYPSALAASEFAAQASGTELAEPITCGMYTVQAMEGSIQVRHRLTGELDVYDAEAVRP
ncbi:MAG: DUF3536 domain-containing protein, partial [Longimicrobiales bacterium]